MPIGRIAGICLSDAVGFGDGKNFRGVKNTRNSGVRIAGICGLYLVPKRNSVVVSYFAPGFNSVVGKEGLLGESG